MKARKNNLKKQAKTAVKPGETSLLRKTAGKWTRGPFINSKTYDILGIGIGPFNLGLAALCYTIPELNCLFIDQQDSFNWHPGLMIEGARLQVPFYADLVTLADPCSPFSYMAFLKAASRMFRFAIHENYFITRKEYNMYGKWVAEQLPALRFNERCISIERSGELYKVITAGNSYYTKNLVIGIGMTPSIPKGMNLENVFHSSVYLDIKESLLQKDIITVVGSGQSAAEIFHDLLKLVRSHQKLSWFTRSPRFFPMEYSNLSLEMSTPDYINHYFSLDEEMRKITMKKQDMLYKGINHSLIEEIYDELYFKSLESPAKKILLHTNCELQNISVTKKGLLDLKFYHVECKNSFSLKSDAVILATGYKTTIPKFLDNIKQWINLDEQGSFKANLQYAIDNKISIFIQNAEQATHGFNAADLSLGPHRNAVIINAILKREQYKVETGTSFQTFGMPFTAE